MLSNPEVQALFGRWELPALGQAYVDRTRSTEPQRLVGSGPGRNTTIRFASQRMGRVIQGESDTVEGAFIRLCEYDRHNVLEFWDQPPTEPLTIINKRGHRQRTTYTPDYLVLRPDGPVVVECKAPSEMARLLRDRPFDWSCAGGDYRYRAAFEHFASIGLRHEIWLPDGRSALKSSNIDLLLAARRAPPHPQEVRWRTKIRTYLAKVTIASIFEVCRTLRLPDATLILKGINEGWLYAPIDRFLLSHPHDALVAVNVDQFTLGCEAMVLTRPHPITGLIPAKTSVPGITQATIMLQRHQELTGSRPATRSARTLRRYKARLRTANGDIRALLPRHRPGNRKPRLTSEHETFLQESITLHHATGTALSAAASHLRYENDFNKAKALGKLSKGEFPVSLKTYLERIKARDAEELAKARSGVRGANAVAAPVDRDYNCLEATRPFQIAHADHYLGDRALTLRRIGKKKLTRKPWVSVLQDEHTTEVLAMAVGFRSPSRKVLSELLRDCVRRHGKLPEIIVSDGGSDFQSVFYESALALLGVHKKDRPTAAPRYGGKLERLFGSLKTLILWTAPGSTRNDSKRRAVSASHRSARLAEQDLIDFHNELEAAIFNQLNFHLRGERLNSSDVISAAGLEMFPMSGVPVEYDQDFMVATSVSAPDKQYQVDRSRGVNVLGRWYWHPKLAATAGKRVEVRLDPWDDELIYALVDGDWACCRTRGSASQGIRDLVAMICRATLRFEGRTELAQAQREGDLDLARYLNERVRTIPIDDPAEEQRDSEPTVEICNTDDIDPIRVNWSQVS